MRSGHPASASDLLCAVEAQVQEATAHELICAGVITRVVVQGVRGGFVLEFRFGERVALLGSARGKPRTFASLNTVATLLQRLSFPSFEVNATGFTPGRLRQARPDRAQAMRDINTKDRIRP